MSGPAGQGSPAPNSYTALGVPVPNTYGGHDPYPPDPSGYGRPPTQYGWAPYQKTGTNGLAVAALILGILPIAGVGAILAVIFGLIARRQIEHSAQTGRGMALAGVILGSLWIAFFIIFVIIAVAHHGHACVGTPSYCRQN